MAVQLKKDIGPSQTTLTAMDHLAKRDGEVGCTIADIRQFVQVSITISIRERREGLTILIWTEGEKSSPINGK